MMRTLTLPLRRARTGCSVLALATVLVVGATPAGAQSFLGDGLVTSGSGTITTGVNSTNITLTTPQTVIDWTPFDNAIANNTTIVFQNSGTTASFAGPLNFAVLNRIIPEDSTRSITMNGTIQSVLAGVGGTNGSIYFYTPGGFVLGASSIINVGSLVLSASPITVTGGNFINGTTVVFGQAPNALATIVTEAGSQINTLRTDSYLAMVAPRVVHNGAITVNGQAALVGAEAATINFSPDGLFDITVDAGTTDVNGVVIGGSIGGAQSTGIGDNNRIYAVAVPKNNALTMLISSGSDLGFNIAGAANVVGNTVVLSAGHDIADGAIAGVSAGSSGAAIANLEVRDSNFTSAMIGEATGFAHVFAFNPTRFYSDATIHADGEIWFSTQAATGSIDVDGNLSLSTAQFGEEGQSVTAGRVDLYTINGGGTITVDGTTTLNASVVAGDSATAGVAGGDATGGGISVAAQDGGVINLKNGLTVRSNAYGGNPLAAGVDGGDGIGGTIFVGTSGTVGANSNLSVTGPVILDANGFGGGGSGAECFSCDGVSGDGFGGSITISSTGVGPSSVAIVGNTTVHADGTGGSTPNGTAGNGRGGGALFSVNTDNLNSLTGNLLLSTVGQGGAGGTGDGGDGRGGRSGITESVGALSGTINIAGNVEISSDGRGGNASAVGASGGDGFGGDDVGGDGRAYIIAFAASTSITGSVNVHSTGTGGSAASGIGGDGRGGLAYFNVTGSLDIGNDASISTNALGGDGTAGGEAFGGVARITANDGGTIDIDGISRISADGFGGSGESGVGGASHGGDIEIYAQNSGNLQFGDNLTVTADAVGGAGATGGGYAQGGNPSLFSQSIVQIDGVLTVSAEATGGALYFTDFNGFSAGDALGGEINIYAANGTLTLVGPADLSTVATGGVAANSADFAGDATGGKIFQYANSGGTLDFQSSLNAKANGIGGAGGIGGDGEGGEISIQANGADASVKVAEATNLSASGVGGYGGSDGESNGDGGLGHGGLATVQSGAGATITFNNNVTVSASATGGNASSGLGGNALGGTARLGAGGGAILITGDLTLTGSATGGTGSTGGNATGLVSPSVDEGLPIAAAIYASSGGSVTVSGHTSLDGRATGGTGFNGNGGNATGGEADVVAAVGGISLNSLAIDVSAGGGSGGNGGNGGSGQGGAVDVAFGLDNAAVNGAITLASAAINADGYGGNGGAGIADNFGGAGGAGGAGSGGGIGFVGSAAGGTLNSGDAILTARGIGGHGGAGGNGDSGTGGNGGAGGVGDGGFIQTGSISQSGALGSGGGAIFADLSVNTNAVGGNGGNGGNGGGGNGAGGKGGDASGGNSGFLIRGVAGTADSVTLTANATGGNGGTGTTFGNGGDATTGIILVESKDRFDVPAQRGTLTANSIAGNAIATGGTGATAGTSTVADGSYFRVLNGDATVGSVSITLSGNLVDPTLGPSFVSVIDGAATIIGSFSFVTDGNLSLFANNGDMHSGNLTLGARNFLFDPVNDPPSDRGTYFADSATITTGNNFVTSADLVIGSSLVINAPGLINAHNFEIDGDLDLIAQSGGITANNLDVTGAIDLDAFGAINLNIVEADFFYADAGSFFTSSDITSDSYIRIFAGDDVTLGEVVAGPATDIDSNKAIRIITDGSVLAGNILSAGGIDITALGSVTGGNVTTGDGLFTDAVGTILYGNISAGLINPQPPSEPFSVGLASGTSISVGNVDASLGIAFVTPGTLTTGYLTTTGEVIGLVNGNISIGNISADDRVLLAGYAMYTDAGGTIPTGDGFNPEDIFAATLVPTNGSITVGSVLAGSFQAAAGTSLTTGLIDTDSEIELDAGGAITTGDLTAGDFVLANGGSITTGNIDANSVGITSTGGDITIGTVVAFGDVELDAFDDIVTGAITAGSIDLAAGDAITTGNLTTQQLLLLDFGDGEITTQLFPGASITLESGGDIATGDIDSIDGVHADAGGSIATGTIDAIDFVELYAVGGIGTGNIAAGQHLWVDSGGSQSLGNLTAGWDIDLEAGGNVAFGNASAGTELDFEVSGNVSGGTIIAGATIEGEAGGSITLGNLTAGFDPGDYVDDDIFSVGIVAEGSIIVGNVQGADAVGFGTLANLTTGNVTGGDLVMTLVSGNTTTGSITTTGESGQVYMAHASMCDSGGGCGEDGDFDPNIVLALAPDPTGGSILINGPVTTGQFQAAAGTTLTIVGNVSADSSVALSSGGAMLIDSVDAGSSIGLRSDASITGDNLTAGTSVLVEANGAISLGNILAGTGISVLDVGPGSAVEIFSHGSIVTGNITTDGYVGLYAEVDVTIGAIDAGHDVIALVGDDASFGAITTPERFFLGGYAMTALVGGGENFNPEGVFDVENPIATGGSASFAGSSSTGNFEAYVGDDTTLASLNTDNSALIETGGLFSLTGSLEGSSKILSNDIAIGSGASITGFEVALVSRNASQTLIGDGLDGLGAGYRLSDAEFDRISTNLILVGADTAYGAAPKMIIGDLSYTSGPDNVIDEIGFVIGNGETETAQGTIRITGDVTINNLLDSQLVYFTADTFQLDAATGSISLYAEGTTLGGRLALEADKVWVASADILAKLEANPLYSGRITELNAPAAVQRPEGVIRAEAIELGDEDGVSSILVQNTGTTATPAGFLVAAASIGEEGGEEFEAAPGSIDLAINGQLVTEGGTVTGIAVRDLLVTEFGTAAFVAGSTINGCALVGPCAVAPPPEPPKVDTVTSTDVQLTDNGGLGDGLFGNEGDIDDGESGDGESRSSPIAPPNPLFDSRPLTQSADVDDPVSGAGNPSLYGETSDEDAEIEDCDSSKDANCKAGTKGDGK